MLPTLLLTAFLLGLSRGSSLCAGVCAPALLPWVVGHRYNLREGLKAGMVVSLPRILLLTTIGAIVGVVSFAPLPLPQISSLGFIILGSLVLFSGACLFANAAEERALGKCVACKRRDTSMLLSFGTALGLACTAELTVIEGTILTSVVIFLGAGGLGALLLFCFAIGSTLPIIATTTAAGKVSERVGGFKPLNLIRTGGGLIMIILGTMLILRAMAMI